MSTILLGFILLSGFTAVLILAIEGLGSLRDRQLRRWLAEREDHVNLLRAESLLGSKRNDPDQRPGRQPKTSICKLTPKLKQPSPVRCIRLVRRWPKRKRNKWRGDGSRARIRTRRTQNGPTDSGNSSRAGVQV